MPLWNPLMHSSLAVLPYALKRLTTLALITTLAACGGGGGGSTTTPIVTPPPAPVDTTAPTISLAGDAEMAVEQGTEFTDPGATASDETDGTVSVSVSGSVDANTAGTYTLTYTASDAAGNEASAERVVTVADTTSPTIQLNGESAITLVEGDAYSEPGASASDSVDGQLAVVITGEVGSDPGEYTLTYTATDVAGNTVSVDRVVTVEAAPSGGGGDGDGNGDGNGGGDGNGDGSGGGTPADTTAPVITLSGSATLSVEQGTSFTDPGASAQDDVDGSVEVTIAGAVDVNSAGSYTLTYSATDNAGNTAFLSRTITVADTTPPS